MANLKAIPFILMGALVHLALMFVLIGDRISCYAAFPKCISIASKICEHILSFPLNLVEMVIGNDLFTSMGFFVYILNSLLAVTILWFVLVRPFVRHDAKKQV